MDRHVSARLVHPSRQVGEQICGGLGCIAAAGSGGSIGRGAGGEAQPATSNSGAISSSGVVLAVGDCDMLNAPVRSSDAALGHAVRFGLLRHNRGRRVVREMQQPRLHAKADAQRGDDGDDGDVHVSSPAGDGITGWPRA